MAASVGSRRPLAFVEDTAVDPEVLLEYTDRFTEILTHYDLKAGYYGHCSVGCLHIRPFVDVADPDQVSKMRVVAEEIRDLVVQFGGNNSSEHGDGLARSEFNPQIFGEELYGAMREVKAIFDPGNRMNPGKIVDASSMTEHLGRTSVEIRRDIPTRLFAAKPEGMFSVADRCMNIGACRKSSAGVMCPSYRATLDEEHSTRGRANALVAALSSREPLEELSTSRLHQILDLCLGCKACKSECPLSVDMAALKSETLWHYYGSHRTPVRTRALGNIHRLNRIGSAVAPLANIGSRSSGVRRILDRTIGVTRNRPLPQFHRRTFANWFNKRGHAPRAGNPRVVLLADCITNFTEPNVPIAAVQVLEAAGWSVELVSGLCCGRASISQGMLDESRRKAHAMTERLLPYARQGIPIVGCEPSCALTLTDEQVTLQNDSPDAQLVAANVFLLEQFLEQHVDRNRLDSRLSPGVYQNVLLHVHCHERALVGVRPAVLMLEMLPESHVTETDAGCCGMAGSFGYEAEHYDVSMKIGGLKLFPMIDGTDSGTVVAATGASCRQQIAHGTGRQVAHPVALLASTLREES
jgi:Fe-S oxidoreductase